MKKQSPPIAFPAKVEPPAQTNGHAPITLTADEAAKLRALITDVNWKMTAVRACTAELELAKIAQGEAQAKAQQAVTAITQRYAVTPGQFTVEEDGDVVRLVPVVKGV